jgi:hypothetical protein
MVEKAPVVEPRIGEGFPAAKDKAKSAISFDEPEAKQKEPCPHCGKEFKHLAKHKCKEKPKGGDLDPKLLELIGQIRGRLGEASVKTMVHILTYAKQRKTGDKTAVIEAPAGWVKETGELHGMLIEYCLAKWGPEQSETYVMVISVLVQWYGVIQINFIETGNAGTGRQKAVKSSPQNDDEKQPDNLRPTGMWENPDSKVSDKTGTPIVNP